MTLPSPRLINGATDNPELVHLTLPSRAENVAVVRHAVAGVAEAIGMEEEPIADLKTVVTEACMNVVIHAYEDEGPLEVSASPEAEGLTVVVRDRGRGIRPRPAVSDDSLRLGLPLIAALSENFEIRGGPEGGTEVRMHLPIARNGEEHVEEPVNALQHTHVSVQPGELVGPIVSRVVSILAARADLSVDRLSDAVLIADAIADHAPDDFVEGRIQVSIEDRQGAIEVAIGPLQPGAAERVLGAMELPSIEGSLRGLADDVRVDRADTNERLILRIAQR
jgi:serine/threonine-protein kinase RsbW